MIDEAYASQNAGATGNSNNSNTETSYTDNPVCRSGTQANKSNSGGSASRDDILSCLPLPASCTQALRKLRAPALTIRYSMEKQFIPDLDAARQRGTNSGERPTAKGQNSSANGSPNASGNSNTQNSQEKQETNRSQDHYSSPKSGSMTEQGNLTVRLFDLAVGGILLAAVSCMVKCCCGMKRMCRHWF